MTSKLDILVGPAIYRIRVEGIIPLDWSDRLMGMNITTLETEAPGSTVIVGRLPDQAALTGILNTLYESRFALLSVDCLEKA